VKIAYALYLMFGIIYNIGLKIIVADLGVSLDYSSDESIIFRKQSRPVNYAPSLRLTNYVFLFSMLHSS
jgi:hypothetical protein